jgi:hypothetical protein
MNISKEVKCLIVRENKVDAVKVDAVPFPPKEGELLITGSVGINPTEQFVLELEEVFKKRSVEELLREGVVSYFITSDELVYREGHYIKIPPTEVKEGDIVIKFSLRKNKREEDIISTPGEYWLRLGFAFIYTPRPAPKKGARAEGKQEVVK